MIHLAYILYFQSLSKSCFNTHTAHSLILKRALDHSQKTADDLTFFVCHCNHESKLLYKAALLSTFLIDNSSSDDERGRKI